MSILGSIIVPHPPLILPEIGKGREQEIIATIDAYRHAAQLVAQWQPDTIVIISPHATSYSDYLHISPGTEASGALTQFDARSTRLTVPYDAALVDEICRQAEACHLPAGTKGQRQPELDHGTLIPLRFLQEAGILRPIVRIGLSGLSPQQHYQLGQCITTAAQVLSRRIAVVASGDLSHKLTSDGPYGYAPQGPDFDRQVTQAMASGNFMTFLQLEPSFCNAAAECGLRAFQIMAGTLDGLTVQAQLHAYEGPFGVGYAVATFVPTGSDPARCFIDPYHEDPYIALARWSLETYIRTGQQAKLPSGLPAQMTKQKAGAFVSLHKNGQLCGCIGTIAPTADSVAQEILQNAIAAGTRDPRFPAIRSDELAQLTYSVDILSEPEPIASPAELDVQRYGVIVTAGYRRGLLLPNLEGVDTIDQQLSIARQKAGIAPNEACDLQRFEVVRHT